MFKFLNIVFATNITLFIISEIIKVINKKNRGKFHEYFYLTEEIMDKIAKEGFLKDEYISKNLEAKRLEKTLNGFALFKSFKSFFVLDIITNTSFLKMIGFEEDKIELVEKNLKTYIRWSRICAEIDTIYIFASLFHVALSFIRVLLLILS